MVERITITIKKDLLKQIDSMVDKNKIKNRSHAIENIITRSIEKDQLDTALIVAGGDDTKLRPITYEIPKALIPIRGRPIIEHQLAMLKRNGIKHAIIAIDYKHEKIKQHLSNNWNSIDISYIIEDQPMGTAGCLSLAKDYINSSFCMLNVDTLVSPDIQNMWAFHKSENVLSTLLLRTSRNISGFGVARMCGNLIVDFSEKPKKSETNIINIGFYIMQNDVLKLVPKKRFMTEQLFSMLIKRRQVVGFMHDGQSYDVSTPPGYESAIKSWKIC